MRTGFFDAEFTRPPANLQGEYLDRAKRAGSQIVRFDPYWYNIAPKRPGSPTNYAARP